MFIFSKSLSAYNNTLANPDPVKELIAKEKNEPLFTILLFDMSKEGLISNTFKHRYRILKEVNGKMQAIDTKWYQVSSDYFWRHENNMGMELAAKDTLGKIHKVATPPGYTCIIGNPRYGYWGDTYSRKEMRVKPRIVLSEEDSTAGSSVVFDTTFVYTASNDPSIDFWYFYPEKKHIKALLQLPTGKIYKKEHNTAHTYHSRGLIFYGGIYTGGLHRYGTYSSHYSSYRGGKKWTRGGGGFGK